MLVACIFVNASCGAVVQSSDAYTSKEKCVLNILEAYKQHHIGFMVKLRSKKILKLYNLEHKLKSWNSKMKENSLESAGVNGWEGRRLLAKGGWKSKARYHSGHEVNDPHLKAFIRKQGANMLLFGKLYSKSTLRKQHQLLAKIRKNWVSTLIKGKSYNQESFHASEIQNFLVNQYNLHQQYKADLEKCRLNTTSSLLRCESLYGRGTCEMLYPGVVHKKCPAGLQRVGCCSCAPGCPNSSFYQEDNYYCVPFKVYSLDPYITQSECEKTHPKCSQVEGRFVGACKTGFTLIADSIECQVDCPKGWAVEEQKCRKPDIVSLGTPLVWIKSDN